MLPMVVRSFGDNSGDLEILLCRARIVFLLLPHHLRRCWRSRFPVPENPGVRSVLEELPNGIPESDCTNEHVARKRYNRDCVSYSAFPDSHVNYTIHISRETCKPRTICFPSSGSVEIHQLQQLRYRALSRLYTGFDAESCLREIERIDVLTELRMNDQVCHLQV